MAYYIAKNKDTLSTFAASYFVKQAQMAISRNGRFAVCLSGGSTPKAMFEKLTKEPYFKSLDWGKVHVFFGDERSVPLHHQDSNYLMAQQALLQHVPIPLHQIYPIQGGLPVKDAAEQYEVKLTNFFGAYPWKFDLIWLGMGDDGHTASLFPYTTVLEENGVGVRAVHVEKLQTDRITFTAPLIKQAHQIAFLISGAGKAPALQSVINGPIQYQEYPSQLIARSSTNIDWLLDEAAAAHLDPMPKNKLDERL